MGAGNVAQVYARWAHLPDRAFRLLVFMSLISLDHDAEPKFWGGREQLAGALGRITPPEPAQGDTSARAEQARKDRRADFEAVKSGIRDLVDNHVIEVASRARPGRNAEYRLCLDAPKGKGEPAPKDRVSLSMGKGDPVDGVGQPYPRGGTRGIGGQHEDTGVDQLASPRARLTYPQAHSILKKLPDLGAGYLGQVDGEQNLTDRIVAAAVLALADQRAAGAS